MSNIVKPNFSAIDRAIKTLENRSGSLTVDQVCELLAMIEYAMSSWDEEIALDQSYVKITEARWWLEQYGK